MRYWDYNKDNAVDAFSLFMADFLTKASDQQKKRVITAVKGMQRRNKRIIQEKLDRQQDLDDLTRIIEDPTVIQTLKAERATKVVDVIDSLAT